MLSATDIAALIASVALAVLVAFTIPVLLRLRRTVESAEQVLRTVERELRPLTGAVETLLAEHRTLAQQAGRSLQDVHGVVTSTQEIVGRLGKVTQALAGLGTVGRALGVLQGLRRGAGVFFRLLGR